MFPHPCGAALAEAVRDGADPKDVVPDDYVVVRGGTKPFPPLGSMFSAHVGPTLESAAAAVPYGQVRVATVGDIGRAGGTVEWVPEHSRHGTLNEQHVHVTEGASSSFSPAQPNPVPKASRIDGGK
jgi:hypothetical protein